MYWLARTSADVPLHDDWLSARERAVLARLRQPKRRDDWRLGRWTAKMALAVLQSLEPDPEVLATIEVSAEPSGAPVLIRSNKRASYIVSLSHSHELALCSLSDSGTLLGCDVESVEARSQAFVDEYFSLADQSQIPAADSFGRDAVVNALWSAKESVLKALGCGLHMDLLRLVVRLGDQGTRGDWRSLSVSVGASSTFEGWWRIAEGFAWTVVAFPDSEAPLPL